MRKWADYLISAIRYEETICKKIISHCKVHADNGDSVGPGTTWSKEEIMDAIEKGVTFYTIIKDISGKWKKGNRVTIKKEKNVYLNDTPENITEDNMVSIPEF